MDASDPFTFLGLKRGILRSSSLSVSAISPVMKELIRVESDATEYVQLKPILAFVTVVLKATGTYKDGSLQADSGCLSPSYLYSFLH